MSDMLWWMLDRPDERDLSKASGEKDYLTPLFDVEAYSESRGIRFSTKEDAYSDWRQIGRAAGLTFAKGKNTILKIVLKVKDEPELIRKWIEYHAEIVGFHNLIVMDCGSTNVEFIKILEEFRERIIIFDYKRYYDQIHQYALNRDFYDLLSGESKYLTVLDADEFLFGIRAGAIHPSFALDSLVAGDIPCVCGTWFSNFYAPVTTEGQIDWRQPLRFRVDKDSVRSGSKAGKALLRSDAISKAMYVGHNLGDSRLEKFVSKDSFGKIGIFHLQRLSHSVVRNRSLQHLISKGVIDINMAPENIENTLTQYLFSAGVKPIEKLYIQRYLNKDGAPEILKPTFETYLLAGGSPERHEDLNAVWATFDYSSFLDRMTAIAGGNSSNRN